MKRPSAHPVFFRSIVVVIITSAMFAGACRQTDRQLEDHTHADAAASAHQYVCPMHPQVTSDQPGKCPICGMDLVEASTGSLMLTSTQERLANIRVQRMTSGSISNASQISARVAANEENRTTISSRAAGRIEKLHVKETGRLIAAGTPLYELYSESLNTQIQEYLILKAQYAKLGAQRDHYASLLKGAENKLLLYGLKQKQIDQLTHGTSRVTFLAPATGTVTELLVTEGQYVEEGTLMVRLDNLAKLWIEADLYPHEASSFKPGDVVSVRLSGVAKPVDVRVSFLTPIFRENTQVVVMRATIDNSDGTLIPGMQATLQRQQQGHQAFQLPLGAVIRDGKNAYAFVRTADHTYHVRKVTTGAENATSIEVTEGLGTSDEVVQSGAYLLYSELVLRNGTNFMTHHTTSN
jgi:membrane fusion protein, copper/silver efflux system